MASISKLLTLNGNVYPKPFLESSGSMGPNEHVRSSVSPALGDLPCTPAPTDAQESPWEQELRGGEAVGPSTLSAPPEGPSESLWGGQTHTIPPEGFASSSLVRVTAHVQTLTRTVRVWMAFLSQWTVGPALGTARLYRPFRPGKPEPHPFRLSGCPPSHPDPMLQEPGDPPPHGGIWGGGVP